MNDDDLITPSNLGDYEIPGWDGFQMWTAAIMAGIGLLALCVLVRTLTS